MSVPKPFVQTLLGTEGAPGCIQRAIIGEVSNAELGQSGSVRQETVQRVNQRRFQEEGTSRKADQRSELERWVAKRLEKGDANRRCGHSDASFSKAAAWKLWSLECSPARSAATPERQRRLLRNRRRLAGNLSPPIRRAASKRLSIRFIDGTSENVLRNNPSTSCFRRIGWIGPCVATFSSVWQTFAASPRVAARTSRAICSRFSRLRGCVRRGFIPVSVDEPSD